MFLLLAVLPFISCDDIETNEVALQAQIGNRLYASNDARASEGADGSLMIQGFTQEETMTLRLSRLGEGNFGIGEGLPNYAVFEDFNGNTYLTNPDGEGLVTISEVDQNKKTLSGTFHFSAMLPGIDTIYVSKGVLYNVPYDGGDIDDPTQAGIFSAKVDGNPFLPIIVSARDTGNSLAISGSTSNATIAITVPSQVEVGENQLPKNGYIAKYQDGSGPQTTSSGQINITAHDPAARTIKGNFSFITNLSEITEGQFEVTY